VHVGGVLHTGDSGATWSPTIDIDADVHQVATADGLVLAAGARGLSTSTDKGVTWSLRTDGLDARYSRERWWSAGIGCSSRPPKGLGAAAPASTARISRAARSSDAALDSQSGSTRTSTPIAWTR